MRKMGILVGSFVVALLGVSLVTGQQPFGGGGGGFGGFGGFGGGGRPDPLALLRSEQVKKELDITEEQMEKLPEAVQKALADVLNEKQLKRLRQIDLQTRGTRAFTDAKVQTTLKITDEQQENIKNILDDSGKELRELFKEAKGGNFQGLREKSAGINKEAQEKVQGVLTADQRKQWKQLIGDEFKMETPGFGGGQKRRKGADNNE